MCPKDFRNLDVLCESLLTKHQIKSTIRVWVGSTSHMIISKGKSSMIDIPSQTTMIVHIQKRCGFSTSSRCEKFCMLGSAFARFYNVLLSCCLSP